MAIKCKLKGMSDRLFVSVVGKARSGKTTTWNTLFGRVVHTGSNERELEVLDGKHVNVFLISGSNEERQQYAESVLTDVNCRIVLCSVQYSEDAFGRTWNYIADQGFEIFAQWLNPGYQQIEYRDSLGLVSRLLGRKSLMSLRSADTGSASRVDEIRQFIHGWALARNLVY